MRASLTPYDYFLYAITVFAWSGSWYALKLQVGVVPVQVSLFWRFMIAAGVMLVWALIAKFPLRFNFVTHLKFAAMGTLMFCLNFALFYYASKWLASGLLSVVFSLVSVFNIMLAVLFLNLRPSANMVIGASLGFIGIAMMFWPVIAGQDIDANALIGFGLSVCGTLFFCLGNLISTSLQRQKVPVIAASTWGMAYGTAVTGIIALIQGDSFAIEWSVSYVGSMIFLAVVSSVIAFAAYLTLLGRIGSDRAGYAAVMFPVVALLISGWLEGYVLVPLAGAGLALVLIGNIFVLGKFRSRKSAKYIS